MLISNNSELITSGSQLSKNSQSVVAYRGRTYQKGESVDVKNAFLRCCNMACFLLFIIGAPVMIGCGVSFAIVPLWAVGVAMLCLVATPCCACCCCLCCSGVLVKLGFSPESVDGFNDGLNSVIGTEQAVEKA